MFGQSGKLRASNHLLHVWILESSSGVCVFDQHYAPISTDADLVAGFFSAMRSFGQEIASSMIEKIMFQNLTFSMISGKQTIVICAFQQAVGNRGSRDLVDLILFEFEHMFYEDLRKYSGNIENFQKFADYLSNLLNRKPIPKPGSMLQSKPHFKIDENNNHYREQESIAKRTDKEILMEGFKRKIDKKVTGGRIKQFVNRKIAALFEREFNDPERIIKIFKIREQQRHQRHAAIERQTRLMNENIEKEIRRIVSLPEDRMNNLVSAKKREEKASETKIHSKKNKKIQKIKAKIKELEEKLAQLS